MMNKFIRVLKRRQIGTRILLMPIWVFVVIGGVSVGQNALDAYVEDELLQHEQKVLERERRILNDILDSLSS